MIVHANMIVASVELEVAKSSAIVGGLLLEIALPSRRSESSEFEVPFFGLMEEESMELCSVSRVKEETECRLFLKANCT